MNREEILEIITKWYEHFLSEYGKKKDNARGHYILGALVALESVLEEIRDNEK